jgi:hypothetical protein
MTVGIDKLLQKIASPQMEERFRLSEERFRLAESEVHGRSKRSRR